MPTIIVAIILIISGGLSMAANASLPGSFLYPIKVNINEKVRHGIERALNTTRKSERPSEKKNIETESSVKLKSNTEIKLQF